MQNNCDPVFPIKFDYLPYLTIWLVSRKKKKRKKRKTEKKE